MLMDLDNHNIIQPKTDSISIPCIVPYAPSVSLRTTVWHSIFQFRHFAAKRTEVIQCVSTANARDHIRNVHGGAVCLWLRTNLHIYFHSTVDAHRTCDTNTSACFTFFQLECNAGVKKLP